MSGKSEISWTDRVWNPVVGCTRVSAGCKFCYAFDVHGQRHQAYKEGKLQNIPQYSKPFSEVQLLRQRLMDPLRWGKPQRIFVNSMSDLFHPDVPEDYIDQIFGVMFVAAMREGANHIFQVLTKRPLRMRDYLNAPGRWISIARSLSGKLDEGDYWWDTLSMQTGPVQHPNIWLGVSVEDQKTADLRVPMLLDTPAGVRFLSCEPLLGPVHLPLAKMHCSLCNVDHLSDNPTGYGFARGEVWCKKCGNAWEHQAEIGWVIVGGESGEHARPMHPDWARDLRFQCGLASVAFHFKQWGTWIPAELAEGKGTESCFLTSSGERREDMSAQKYEQETVHLVRSPRGRSWKEHRLNGVEYRAVPEVPSA